MTIGLQTPPARPRVVVLGIPYLALLWVGLLATLFTIGGGVSDLWPMTLWTLIWYTVLYRAWSGGPQALRAVTLLTTVIPGVVLVGGVVLIAVVQSSGLPGLFQHLPATFYLTYVGYAGALVVGIGLTRVPVREWSLALHPPKTRAESAVLGVRPAAPPAGSPDTASATDAPYAGPLFVDIGSAMRRQGKFRIGCFGVLLAFFPGIPLIIGLVTFVRDGDPAMLAPFGAFLVIFVVALAISYARFRRKLAAGGTLTIDDRGLVWAAGIERAELPWGSLAGVGISYYLAYTRSGRKMHLPQLDVFEATPSPPNRLPRLDGMRRLERPPAPGLPEQRFRLMLPASDPLHRTVEATVQHYRSDLWIGWFERSRSDTPWFLR